MGTIINTTDTPSSYNLVSQTPKNIVPQNYYLHTLQQKVLADWKYRYNVVQVEQESVIGGEEYFPLEVVIQSVRNDKGTKVSDDIRRLVFKDIKYDVRLGTKFRFSYSFDINLPDEEKNVWLATNKDSTSPTGQVVITRCNGTLGSTYIDEKGNTQYHYEPVISGDKLSGANFNYNEVIVVPQAQLTLTVQHNEFTKTYFINQRFVVGYDKVYKIKAIDKANSLKTFDPMDVGLVILYAEVDEVSPLDDFTNRIAYNGGDTSPVIEKPTTDYSLSLYEPSPLPLNLTKTPTVFRASLFNNDIALSIPVEVSVSLPNCSNPSLYFDFVDNGDNSFVLTKKQTYNRGELVVLLTVTADNSPTGESIEQEYSFGLKGVY